MQTTTEHRRFLAAMLGLSLSAAYIGACRNTTAPDVLPTLGVVRGTVTTAAGAPAASTRVYATASPRTEAGRCAGGTAASGVPEPAGVTDALGRYQVLLQSLSVERELCVSVVAVTPSRADSAVVQGQLLRFRYQREGAPDSLRVDLVLP